jgi:hypothetical protein
LPQLVLRHEPAAAWRLEAAGFGPVYDYAAGKADWLAADLAFEGTAQLAGMFTLRRVATVKERTTAAEVLRLLDAQGFGPVLDVNRAGVVMGAAYREGLASAAGQAEMGSVMRFVVSRCGCRPAWRRTRRARQPMTTAGWLARPLAPVPSPSS